jgi:peptidoglycan/xylan/chitin deacetylase (PgdA/CDA1 family)
MRALLLGLVLLISNNTYSAGVELIAKSNSPLWREPINTAAGFDKASRAMLLVYVSTLQTLPALSDNEIKTRFKIKSVNRDSVNRWLNKELTLALSNYQHASENCTNNDWSCLTDSKTVELLVQQSHNALIKIPADYQSWLSNSQAFARNYSDEQLRLAALFPKVSSEIDSFNTNEWNGDNFADKQFLLSFDDGPSAVGNTDKTLTMLEQAKKSAVFFLLGENLQQRLKASNLKTVQQLYERQCVASHGWQHQSHAKWSDWQGSIQRTQALLNSSFAETKVTVLPWFRPPYGQRLENSGAFFEAQKLQVALWNIDSQDWQQQISSEDIVNRMLGLMLIKRRGVLLFHDVHSKAELALPAIFQALGNSVTWRDCANLVL